MAFDSLRMIGADHTTTVAAVSANGTVSTQQYVTNGIQTDESLDRSATLVEFNARGDNYRKNRVGTKQFLITGTFYRDKESTVFSLIDEAHKTGNVVCIRCYDGKITQASAGAAPTADTDALVPATGFWEAYCHIGDFNETKGGNDDATTISCSFALSALFDDPEWTSL